MTDFSDTLRHLEEGLVQEYPLIAEIFDSVRAGTLGVPEAIRRIWLEVVGSTETAKQAEEILLRAFGVEPETTSLAVIPDREKMLDRWGFTEEDLIFQPVEGRTQYALHPILMGMIIELLQFDGDVPELRTGRLPEGGTPAVPVQTESRDPVTIGVMLRRASREVAKELETAQQEHDHKVAKIIEAIGGSNEAAMALVRRETERAIGVSGYQPGHHAAMRKVAAPTANDLAALPFSERQELSHKTLVSTQGRRSVSPVIETMVLAALHAKGYTGVSLGEDGVVLVEADWIVMIDGSRREHNPRFNFIDTAARSLSSKLQHYLAGQAGRYTRLRLKVSPVNTVAEREVGWRATLYE